MIIRNRQLKKDLVKFLVEALYSARPSTIRKAIKKIFLTSFPGLFGKLIDKHLPVSIATEMGHLRQENQHLQSTSSSTLSSNKATSPSDLIAIEQDFFPPREPKTKHVIFAITHYSTKEVAAADLTGCFQNRSSHRHKYVMIMYHWDCNAIWGQALKNR